MDEKWRFYAAFEDRYRGSFEEIKGRVSAYLPYVRRQPTDLAPLRALDLGSGRGEWLSVLKDHGVRAMGVDQNPVAAARARDQGLEVQVGDLFKTLAEAATKSCRVVTAFHVIEHLSWEQQLSLFIESHRVLATGGILIVEWPNIENLLVSSQHFWMDPTHVRPLPLALAAFMAEYAGFSKIEANRFRAPLKPALQDSPPGCDSFFSLNRFFGSGRVDDEGRSWELAELVKMMSTGFDIALICER